MAVAGGATGVRQPGAALTAARCPGPRFALGPGEVTLARQHGADRYGHVRAEPASAAGDPADDRSRLLGVASSRREQATIGRDQRDRRPRQRIAGARRAASGCSTARDAATPRRESSKRSRALAGAGARIRGKGNVRPLGGRRLRVGERGSSGRVRGRISLCASAIRTSQPSCSSVSCTNRAPVIDSITARTGSLRRPTLSVRYRKPSASGAAAISSTSSPSSEIKHTSNRRRQKSSPTCNIDPALLRTEVQSPRPSRYRDPRSAPCYSNAGSRGRYRARLTYAVRRGAPTTLRSPSRRRIGSFIAFVSRSLLADRLSSGDCSSRAGCKSLAATGPRVASGLLSALCEDRVAFTLRSPSAPVIWSRS